MRSDPAEKWTRPQRGDYEYAVLRSGDGGCARRRYGVWFLERDGLATGFARVARGEHFRGGEVSHAARADVRPAGADESIRGDAGDLRRQLVCDLDAVSLCVGRHR